MFEAFFIASVFMAGILMFLAPCTLPLVPAYLAFISGVKADELENSVSAKVARRSIVLNGIFFVLGFTTIFVGFGILAGFFGSYVGQFRGLLAQVGGAFIIFFGLMVLGVFQLNFFSKERKFELPSFVTPGRPTSAFVIGATFALGWSPCVGPVLASVLLLATTSTTVLEGAFLLSIFSLGLAVPFLLTALLYSYAITAIHNIARLTKWVSYVGGIFLIILGTVLMTGNFGYIIEYGYRVFNLLGLEVLFEYL